MVRGMARTVVGRQVQPFMGLLYLVLFRQQRKPLGLQFRVRHGHPAPIIVVPPP
jgi:phosphoribosylamine-glycine ligase